MRIGRLAELTATTPRTLRHYEQLGLITPSSRSSSGYRFYDASAVGRLSRISALQQLGLSLEQIAEVIDAYDLDPRGIAGKREVLSRLSDQLEETERRLVDLHAFRDELRTTIATMRAWLEAAE